MLPERSFVFSFDAFPVGALQTVTFHLINPDAFVKSPKTADMSLRAKRGNLVTHRIT
jgi:hypothetical protein